MRASTVARPPLFLTVSDAARRLARHEQTIRAMIRRGELTAVRLGRFVRVFADVVEARRLQLRPRSVRPRRPAARVPRGLQAPSRV